MRKERGEQSSCHNHGSWKWVHLQDLSLFSLEECYFPLNRDSGSSKHILGSLELYPIASMHGMFTYIYNKHQPNVGIYIYSIHGSHGYV